MLNIKNFKIMDVFELERVIAFYKYATYVNDGISIYHNGPFEKDGKFHRYAGYGPFADIVKILEKANLMDNKIALKFRNGAILGYYDNTWYIGTDVNRASYGKILTESEFQERIEQYLRNR